MNSAPAMEAAARDLQSSWLTRVAGPCFGRTLNFVAAYRDPEEPASERHTRFRTPRGERSWPALLDVAPESDGIDLAAVRRYRQERVRAEMAARGIGAVILSDSVNIRYASGSRNMQVFTSRNAPSRYLVLTGDRSILFEFTGCEHLADGLDTIDEVRPALTASYVGRRAGHQ